MKRLSGAKCIEELGHHRLMAIRSSIVAGWARYEGLAPELKAIMSRVTRAGFIHDFMVEHADKAFDALHDVRRADRNGLIMYAFADSIVLRFKKLDDELTSRNHRTRQSDAYLWQQMEFEGLEAPTFLQAGYVLNDLGTALEGMYLACPNGRRNLWVIQYDLRAEENRVIPLRPRDAQTQRTRPGYRVLIEDGLRLEGGQ